MCEYHVESGFEALVEMVNKGLDDLHPLKAMIDIRKFLQNQLCEMLLISPLNPVCVLSLEFNICCNLLHITTDLLDDLCEIPKFREVTVNT